MKPRPEHSGRLDRCARLLQVLGLDDAHLYLCSGAELLACTDLSDDPGAAFECADAGLRPRVNGRFWCSEPIALGLHNEAATIFLSTVADLPSPQVLKLLASNIEHEWRQNEAIEDLSLELGNRYEELNLLYGFDDTLNLSVDAPLSGLVRDALQNCVDFLDIDAAGVWAPRYDLGERAFADADNALVPLVNDKLDADLLALLRGHDRAIVFNDAPEPATIAGVALPFRVIAVPISQGARPLAGVLTLARSFANGPFTNSDRKLAHVLAAEMSQALDQRFDSVTGLMNHETFEKTILAESTGDSDSCAGALAHIDLDQFKLINEACGHEAGDRLLKLTATLLREAAPSGVPIARFGADEFIVLLPGLSTVEVRDLIAHTQTAISEQRFIHGDRSFEITVSTGITGFSNGQNLSAALAEAELACQAAKDLGGARARIYAQGDAQVQVRHSEMRWAAEIRNALDEDRLELFGQAICATNDPDGTPSHYEVLLRMYDEETTMVSPAIFIPAAERYGLISRIDRWVVSKALAALNDCYLQGIDTRLTVNLSGASLGDDEFRDFAREALSRANIAPGTINFEITETAAISNIGQAMGFIREMKERGCDFLLDDFGTGMSSYAYLRQFPVEYVKIDGSFVKNMHQDDFNRSIVESIHHICRAGGKRTIAEFVENDAILAVLQEIGVDFVQGYRIDKPSPLSAKLALHLPAIRAAG